jgi:methylthioribose-1-phosphate isomerase
MNFKTIEWKDNQIIILDQTQLPEKTVYLVCKDYREIASAIKTLKIRGAPAIGIAAAYGVALGMLDFNGSDIALFRNKLDEVTKTIASTRPTAVNLFWALEKMKNFFETNSSTKTLDKIRLLLINEALRIHQEDREMCDKIGKNGAVLLNNENTVLTHCNAGALATGGIGTALAIIYTAQKNGKKIKVYVDETRPLLQGARLTCWELMQEGIDTTLICDDMAATLMQQKKIDCIIVGADRIASNYDVANKIGTYGLAVLAKYHNIPFYVAAPMSTFDQKIKSGEEIKIEERSAEEVTEFWGKRTAPVGVKVFSPAFDVTPHNLITAIITDQGIIKP